MGEFRVAPAFEQFCKNLNFSLDSYLAIISRYHSITKRINEDYWDTESDSAHSLYVGSYGRGTEIEGSDIDMLVQLPYDTYVRFNNYAANGQSALLQEVKNVIAKTYSSTYLKADGQIISVPFSDSITFEVLPAFLNRDGSYTFANSNDGGSWKITDPKAEIQAITERDKECNHNLKRLCRMARAWRLANDVGISGILIDIFAYRFIANWEYNDMSYFYYDEMTRDFMKYVSELPSQDKWKVMGSDRYIYCSGNFSRKAKEAYDLAVEAIECYKKYPSSANDKWREIYGSKFPKL